MSGTRTEPGESAERPRWDADAETLAADQSAVAAVRDGDREAYGRLVERHLPRLHALLRRFFHQASDVDDLSQAAFLRAYEQLDRFDAERPFYPWLRTIAVNLALHELEKRRRRREVEDPEPSFETAIANVRLDANLHESELVAATQRELQRLPPQWAAVFRLRVYEDLSYAEIAQTLSIPIGTVMSSLARARLRLAQSLAAEFGPRRDEP